MTTFEPQDITECKDYLEEHYLYEVNMLMRGLEVAHENIQVEIVLLHTRNLIEFHLENFDDDKKNVKSTNFGVPLNPRTDWPEAGKIYGLICAGLSHMGSSRLAKPKEKWDLIEIETKLLSIAQAFLNKIDPQYKTPKTNQLEKDISNKLTMLKNLQAQPGFIQLSSTTSSSSYASGCQPII